MLGELREDRVGREPTEEAPEAELGEVGHDEDRHDDRADALEAREAARVGGRRLGRVFREGMRVARAEHAQTVADVDGERNADEDDLDDGSDRASLERADDGAVGLGAGERGCVRREVLDEEDREREAAPRVVAAPTHVRRREVRGGLLRATERGGGGRRKRSIALGWGLALWRIAVGVRVGAGFVGVRGLVVLVLLVARHRTAPSIRNPNRLATISRRAYASPVFCVAVCALARSLEGEAEAIAAVLGLAPYDVRIRLGGVLPRIALQVDDLALATRLAEGLRSRGHGAIVFDADEAPLLGAMPAMRRFGLDGQVLYANDRRPPSQAIGDLAVVARVAMNVRVARSGRDSTFRMSVRGRLRLSEKVDFAEQVIEQMAVLYWRDGAAWLLRESDARYIGLGADVAPTVHANYLRAMAWLRANAPGAIFDDRFLAASLSPQRSVHVIGNETAAPLGSDRGIEYTLHALGLWLRRGRGGPYR